MYLHVTEKHYLARSMLMEKTQNFQPLVKCLLLPVLQITYNYEIMITGNYDRPKAKGERETVGEDVELAGKKEKRVQPCAGKL